MAIPEAGQWEEGRGLRGLHAGGWAARASSPQRCFVKCRTDVCVYSPVGCMCVFPWCVYALSNPSLRELPPELGQLGNLWQLDIEDLNISNVPAEIRKEGRASSALQAPLPGKDARV